MMRGMVAQCVSNLTVTGSNPVVDTWVTIGREFAHNCSRLTRPSHPSTGQQKWGAAVHCGNHWHFPRITSPKPWNSHCKLVPGHRIWRWAHHNLMGIKLKAVQIMVILTFYNWQSTKMRHPLAVKIVTCSQLIFLRCKLYWYWTTTLIFVDLFFTLCETCHHWAASLLP